MFNLLGTIKAFLQRKWQLLSFSYKIFRRLCYLLIGCLLFDAICQTKNVRTASIWHYIDLYNACQDFPSLIQTHNLFHTSLAMHDFFAALGEKNKIGLSANKVEEIDLIRRISKPAVLLSQNPGLS